MANGFRTPSKRAQRRSGLQSQGGAAGQQDEKPITTGVGINLTMRKVVMDFSTRLQMMLMPPAGAMETAKHLIQSARALDPDLPPLTLDEQSPSPEQAEAVKKAPNAH
jgi:hypothetical protein